MVVVANVASLVLPQGNPTNLVVMQRLGLSAPAFASHMALPGLAAATIAALAVAAGERRALRAAYQPSRESPPPLTREERSALAALALAALAAWSAPLVGIAPWWPFTAAVALTALAAGQRPQLRTATSVGLQVAALVVLTAAVRRLLPLPSPHGLAGVLALAAGVAVAAAVANNLSVSVSVTGLLAASAAYPATIGLAAGALALPRGSVATMIAVDAAGSDAPVLSGRRLAPVAALAVTTATLLVFAGL